MKLVILSLLGVVLNISPALAAKSVRYFNDGSTEYQRFLMSHPNIRVISVKAIRHSHGDIIADSDEQGTVFRRVTRAGLMVTYE